MILNKSILQIILTVLLLISSVILIQQDNFYKLNFKLFPFLESQKNFLFPVLGFKTITADILWMDIIQYVGDKEKAKENYHKLYPKTLELIKVDPNFTYAYLLTSGMLMFEEKLKDPDKAIELIKDGIKHNPKYWQLSLYLAAYTYSKAGNIKMALFNIENAVYQEGHPPMLERILGSMYLKLADEEKAYKHEWLKKAINLWLHMYEHPSEKLNKTYAEEHLKKYGLIKD